MRRIFAAAITAALFSVLFSTSVEARKRQRHLSTPSVGCVVTDRNPCSSFSGPFDRQLAPSVTPNWRSADRRTAKRWRAQRQAYHGGLGPKPRASCGWTMRAQFGGKYGPEFNRAYAWAKLPRTSLQPGAVVVTSRKGRGCGGPCGHVVKVLSVIDACNAIVQDNRGTYKRNTCRSRVAVVMP